MAASLTSESYGELRRVHLEGAKPGSREAAQEARIRGPRSHRAACRALRFREARYKPRAGGCSSGCGPPRQHRTSRRSAPPGSLNGAETLTVSEPILRFCHHQNGFERDLCTGGSIVGEKTSSLNLKPTRIVQKLRLCAPLIYCRTFVSDDETEIAEKKGFFVKKTGRFADRMLVRSKRSVTISLVEKFSCCMTEGWRIGEREMIGYLEAQRGSK